MPRVAKELLEALLLALVALLVLQSAISNFRVEGASMYPTLASGEYLIVNRLVYLRVDAERLARIVPFWKAAPADESPRAAARSPQRGEVVVFNYPLDPTKDFVKRVVGLPGELVEVRAGTVYIDGAPLPEPYLRRTDHSSAAPLRLGPEEYYVIGDNRPSSNDSRSWGAVPAELILGKVWVVYWPFSAMKLLGAPAY